jgi:hypothetical protein
VPTITAAIQETGRCASGAPPATRPGGDIQVDAVDRVHQSSFAAVLLAQTAGAQHARGIDAAHQSGRHITPRQAGFAFEAEAVRALVSLPTRADGYARSAVANVRA